MGYRNHLHVCQHCGIVHATSSATGPRKCVVCDAFMFSEYEPNRLLEKGKDADPQLNEADRERAKWPSSLVSQP